MEIQRNCKRFLEIRFKVISPFRCLREQTLPIVTDSPSFLTWDREREMSRFYHYQFTIRLAYHARARARARTLWSCFSASRVERRSYLVTSRLFPRLERPFTNSHDFTEPIVRLDDGEAYYGCCIGYPLGQTSLSLSFSLSLRISLEDTWRW